MSKTTIYVIRHAQSFHNIGNYEEKSHVTVGLTQEGEAQARQLANEFCDIHLDKIYSSEYTRAYKTALTLAENRNLEVERDSTIHEKLFGDTYRNRIEESLVEMRNIFKNLSEEEKFIYSHYPDMESAKVGAMRLRDFLLKVGTMDEGKVVAVVCHGNIMRSFLNLIGWASFEDLPEGAIKNTGYFKLEMENNEFKILETSKIEKGRKAEGRIM